MPAARLDFELLVPDTEGTKAEAIERMKAMNYWQRLWRIEVISLAALGVFSFAVAAVLVLEGLIVSPMEFSFFDYSVLGFALTFGFGFLPVVLFGAPIYAAVIAADKLSWRGMLVVAVLPGVAILFFRAGLGIIGIIGGTCIFLMVHFAYHRRFVRHKA